MVDGLSTLGAMDSEGARHTQGWRQDRSAQRASAERRCRFCRESGSKSLGLPAREYRPETNRSTREESVLAADTDAFQRYRSLITRFLQSSNLALGGTHSFQS